VTPVSKAPSSFEEPAVNIEFKETPTHAGTGLAKPKNWIIQNDDTIPKPNIAASSFLHSTDGNNATWITMDNEPDANLQRLLATCAKNGQNHSAEEYRTISSVSNSFVLKNKGQPSFKLS
jgi:hypothetical protein